MGKFLCKSHKDAAKVVKIIEIYKNYNKKVYFFFKKYPLLASSPLALSPYNFSLRSAQKSYVNLIALFVRPMYSVIHCRRLLVSLAILVRLIFSKCIGTHS